MARTDFVIASYAAPPRTRQHPSPHPAPHEAWGEGEETPAPSPRASRGEGWGEGSRRHHDAKCTYSYSTGRLLTPLSGGAIQAATLPGSVTGRIRLMTNA